MPIIDVHPHIISADKAKYPISPAAGAQSIWHNARPATWEELSEQMGLAGVDKAAVVQASTAYDNNNSYVADTVDENSDRITGVGSIGLLDDDVMSQLQHWIVERGLSGVRLYVPRSAPAGSFMMADEKANPAWEWLAEHQIPVAMTIGDDTMSQLRTVIDRFPNLRVALDHAGRIRFESDAPFLKDHQILDFVDDPGVFLKITTVTLLSAGGDVERLQTGLAEVVSHFGSDRLAWGSNWPATEGNYPDFKDLAVQAVSGLPQADADNILGGTALKLYPKLA